MGYIAQGAAPVSPWGHIVAASDDVNILATDPGGGFVCFDKKWNQRPLSECVLLKKKYERDQAMAKAPATRAPAPVAKKKIPWPLLLGAAAGGLVLFSIMRRKG